MIIDAIIAWALDIVIWIASLFQGFHMPLWLYSVMDMARNLLYTFANFGAWVDWLFLLACVGAVTAVYIAGFVFRLVRAILAHVPFVGGSGA